MREEAIPPPSYGVDSGSLESVPYCVIMRSVMIPSKDHANVVWTFAQGDSRVKGQTAKS